jgi:predicted PurR-regulated permease PerM
LAYSPRRPDEHTHTGELQLFAKKVGIVCAVGIALGVLWLVRHIIILIFIAAILAAGIAPVVRRVQTYWRLWFRRKIARGPAVMIVYLPFVGLILLMAVLLVPHLISDSRELATRLPALVEENLLRPLERYIPMGAIREQLREPIDIPRSSVFGYVRGAATAIGAIIVILVMVAYILVDAERLRNLVLLFYPPDVRGKRRRTLRRMGRRMSSWLAGQLLLSAIIGVCTFIGLVALRIPYAIPLSILAAIGEMVPVIGPTLGAIPALMVALLASRWQFWSVLAFAVLLQKAENLFIVPRVMSKKVAISPLAVVVAFMIGASLLGLVGAIIAVPAAALVQVAFEEAFVRRRERRQDLDRSGTLLRRVD